MQYILLIYSNEAQDMEHMGQLSKEEQGAWMGEWFQYTEDLKAAGAFVAGDALQPTQSAETISWRNGDAVTTDGPFAETKEQLGGYYLVDVETRDEAIQWAKKMPHHDGSRVEVRPVMVFE